MGGIIKHPCELFYIITINFKWAVLKIFDSLGEMKHINATILHILHVLHKTPHWMTISVYFLGKYFFKEINCQSSEWFSYNIYIMDNSFLFYNTFSLLYDDIWLHNVSHQLSQIYKLYHFSVRRLYDTGLDLHKYFWYYIPSIIYPIPSY